MHEKREAHLDRTNITLELSSERSGRVGNRLHRGDRCIPFVRINPEFAANRLSQGSRKAGHWLNLEGVSNNYGSLGAQHCAHYGLRYGLARFVDKEPAERLRRQSAQHPFD